MCLSAYILMLSQVAPGVVIVPLNSWYHYSYDTSDPRPGKLRFDR